MKCFKHSNSRNKLDKTVVFANNKELFERFLEFEKCETSILTMMRAACYKQPLFY